ncbi:S8 family serine peptidase [Rhodocaloribacter sp.]
MSRFILLAGLIVPVSQAQSLNDPRLPEQWGPAKILAPEAWSFSSGAGVTVAVIDTGIDWRHEDLAPNVWQNLGEDADGDGHTLERIDGRWQLDPGDLNGIDDDDFDDDPNTFVDDLIGWDFIDGDNDPMDTHGHGTHVAGIIGAAGGNGAGGAGVAWGARLMALRVSADRSFSSAETVIAALDYARRQGVRLTNNSYGGFVFFGNAMREALEAADGAGMLFVAGAGNDGANTDRSPFFPAGHDLPNIIAVAATGRDDRLLDLSNYGPTSVDVAAPGDDILSTTLGGGYGTSSGTSMATAFVTGVAALLWAAHPELTMPEVRELILGTVDVTPELTEKTVSGGRVNALQPATGLIFTPNTLDFGNVGPGNQRTETLRIRNVTPNTRTLGIASDRPAFLPETESLPLPPGETTLDVTFRPPAPGPFEGVLTLTLDGVSFTIAVRGSANPVVADRASLDFGLVSLGSERRRTLTLVNVTSAARTVRLSTDHAAFAPATLSVEAPPNDSVTVEVVFAPATTGTFGGTLTAASDDAEISVTLSGVADRIPVIEVSPNAVSETLPRPQFVFRNAPDQSAFTTDTLVIRNRGSADLNWSIPATPPSWLTLSAAGGAPNPREGVLRPGESARLVLGFLPWKLPVGLYRFALPIASNTPDASLRFVFVDLNVSPLVSIGSRSTLGDAVWGDFDGDDDLDLALVIQKNDSSYLRIVRNDGPDGFVNLQEKPVGFTPYSEPFRLAWGDYDRDGDLDLLLNLQARSSTSSILFRNDGDEGFTALPDLLPGLVAWGDYDNDGDLDLLGNGYLLRNDSSDRFTPVRFDSTLLRYINGNGDLISLRRGQNSSFVDVDTDGDLDLLHLGEAALFEFERELAWRLYLNEGNGVFSRLTPDLPPVTFSSVEWHDYDNDGDPDLLMAGGSSDELLSIYRNDGDGKLTEVVTSLPALSDGTARWGDFDNDGNVDVALAGNLRGDEIAGVYRNEYGAFTPAAPLPAVCCLKWGDFDNDGDLDLINDRGSALNFFLNNGTPNALPTPPAGLSAVVAADTVFLRWEPAEDAETPSAGLTYNLRVGSSPGGIDVVAPMANAETGFRRIVAPGNVWHNTAWRLRGLPDGAYYWSVQAVDHTFAGGPFAEEGFFRIGAPVGTSADLLPNYPNPFRAATTLVFELPEAAHVRLTIYDVLGRRVATLVDGMRKAGAHTVRWEPGRTAAGVYFCRLEAGASTATRALTRMK